MTPDPGPQTPDPVTPLKVSILIATRNRPDVLRRCVESVAGQNYPDMEVIILDDASNPPVDQVAIKRLVRGQHPIRILRSEEHLGLISIRNKLIEEASGDVLFVIDDDAYFEGSGSIQSIVDAFRGSPDHAVIAVKIIDYRGGKQRPLTPHDRQSLKNDPALVDRPHRVSYFLGGGHALQRSIIDQCGCFDETLVFGHEELDFAYRVLEQGFAIHYLPTVVLHHEPPEQQAQSRSRIATRQYYLMRNRILVAYKHLPWRYAAPYVAGWLVRYGYTALKEGVLDSYLRGVFDGFKALRSIRRHPVSEKTVCYLKENYGRLWY